MKARTVQNADQATMPTKARRSVNTVQVVVMVIGMATHPVMMSRIKKAVRDVRTIQHGVGMRRKQGHWIGVHVDVDGVFVILRCNAMFGQRESLWRYRRQRVRFNARTLRSHVQGVGFVNDGLLQTPIFGGAPQFKQRKQCRTKCLHHGLVGADDVAD